jgi:hypothetical protein
MLLAGGLLADRQIRAQEANAIVDRVVAGQQAVLYAERRVSATVQYTSPLLLSVRVSGDVRRSLEAIVRQSAGERARALRTHLKASSEVRVVPWHRALREARDQYVRLLESRITYFESISEDIAGLFYRDPALVPAESAARRALLAAVSGERAQERVRALFTGP